MNTALNLGNVVTVRSGSRRFVVVANETFGGGLPHHNLRALTGAFAGSGPSGMSATDLTLSPDQSVVFGGAIAAKLQRDARQAICNAVKTPEAFKAITASWR